MKPDVRKRVRGDRLDAVLPPQFSSRLRAGVRSPDVAYTVLLFPHSPSDVVRSPPVVKALARLPAGTPIVAVAGNFTAEARRALSERGAVVLTLGDFHWTDESYVRIREPRPGPKR